MKSDWKHRLLLFSLAMTTLGAVVIFGAPSERTWSEQRNQIAAETALAAQLDAEISTLSAEVEIRTSEAGIRREALCFGPYVTPGTEVYAVIGVRGCVTEP